MFSPELADALHADRRARFEGASMRHRLLAARRRPDPKADALRAVPGFRALRDRELDRLARIVDDVAVTTGTVLMREGDPGRQAFVITAGTAAVTVGDETVAEVGPGELIGELAMLGHAARSATITATTPMRLLVIGAAEFPRFLSHPLVAHAVAHSLAARLRATDERLRALAA